VGVRWLGLIALAAGALAAGALALGGSGAGAASGPATCPSKAPAGVPVNLWPAAKRKLAPAGAGAIRLCRYAGLNTAATPGSLVGSRLVRSAPLVGKLVWEFGQLKQAPPGAVFACPNDDGSQALALLAYRHGEEVTISVDMTGCSGVSNGDVSRTASGYGTPVGPRLVAQLAPLTRR